MDCLSPKDLLAASEGLLSESEQREQAAHLAHCPRCGKLARTVRELARLATAVAPTAPLAEPGSCPAETELLDYVDQRLAGTARNQMEAHLAACRQCLWQVAAMARTAFEAPPAVAPEWREAVRRAEALVAEPPQAQVAGWWLAPAWRYALASAAVLALAAGLYWNAARVASPPVSDQAQAPVTETSPAPTPPDEPPLLAQQTPPSRPGAAQQPEVHLRTATSATQPPLQVLWPQEGQAVAREELEIRWQTVPGAQLYEVTILNRSGDVVWEGESRGDRMRVPDGANLQAGERYFVWVETHAEGDGAARSHSVAFEIRAPATR